MSALLHHTAIPHHGNLVRTLDCGQPVGNDQGGEAPPGLEPVQRLLDLPLALVVQRRGGLIQQQDRRAAQHRPSNRDPLLLPAGEQRALLPHVRGVPLLEAQDKVMGVGGLGSRNDLLLCGLLQTAISNVVPDGGGEEHRLLADIANATAQPPQVVVTHIPSVHQHLALSGGVEAEQQGHGRALAPPAGPNQRHRLARRRGEVEACGAARASVHHCIRPCWVHKVHPLELYVALQPSLWLGTCLREAVYGQVLCIIHEVEDTLGRQCCSLLITGSRPGLSSPKSCIQQGHESGKCILKRTAPLADLDSHVPHRQGHGQHHRTPRKTKCQPCAQPRFHTAACTGPNSRHVVVLHGPLQAEGRHGVHGGDGGVQHGARPAVLRPVQPVRARDGEHQHAHAGHVQRHHGQDHEGHTPGEYEAKCECNCKCAQNLDLDTPCFSKSCVHSLAISI
mmetsp:Transcript_26495/g.43660  ORF Transcript_26495/g.43660 Transcript_26495/m.43660 type:complete len:450 (+) Transcript_26495:494-1843(+)